MPTTYCLLLDVQKVRTHSAGMGCGEICESCDQRKDAWGMMKMMTEYDRHSLMMTGKYSNTVREELHKDIRYH